MLYTNVNKLARQAQEEEEARTQDNGRLPEKKVKGN